MPNGNDAFVLPLSILSPQLSTNSVLLKGELVMNQDPYKSIDIALSVIIKDERNKRAFNLLGDSLQRISNHRDAITAYKRSAYLSTTEEEFNKYLKLADIEANKILTHQKPSFEIVCTWNDCFFIHAPSEWIQYELDGIDESLALLFVSCPSPYIPNDTIDFLMINEIHDAPDFSSFLDKIHKDSENYQKYLPMYFSLVSEYFSFDSKSFIYGIQYSIDSDKTKIYINIYGEADGKKYCNYHCWIIPNESLNIDSALFLLMSCSADQKVWMDELAIKLFDKSTEYNKMEMNQKFLVNEKEIKNVENDEIVEPTYKKESNVRKRNVKKNPVRSSISERSDNKNIIANKKFIFIIILIIVLLIVSLVICIIKK